jgi:tRNA pseudouridine13 synthase
MDADGPGLPAAFGGPPLRGRVRERDEDFRVVEELGFEPSGSGEHALLWVEKQGANTEWVARQLARFAGVAPVAVGFAGLKDRHAITRQAFTVQLPGRADPDWTASGIPGVRVLSAVRHARKLPRGALRGNRFELVVRGVEGDRAAAEARLAALASRGLPNGFGEQRFGRGGGNLDAARAMFGGRRVERAERSILLSAARSALFNAVLARRIADGTWERLVDGDVAQLDGTGSVFGPVQVDDTLAERCARLDIHPTGPLWGRGDPRSGGAVREREQAEAQAAADLAAGLAAAGLAQERRALRAPVRSLAHAWEGDALRLSFALPAGSYATALLQELVAG